MKLRVVLAEDNALLRDGITLLLAAAADIDVVAGASDLPSLYAAVAEHAPDVLVTDIRMPPGQHDEGLVAADRYREERPEMGIVVLSQHVSPSYAVRLLGDGRSARAYLLKDRVSHAGELTDAIRRVASGGSVVDPQVIDELMYARRHPHEQVGQLTGRELAVLELVAAGHSNAYLAAHLFLSVRAVEKHISSIFLKLGLPDDSGTNRRVRAVVHHLASRDR